MVEVVGEGVVDDVDVVVGQEVLVAPVGTLDPEGLAELGGVRCQFLEGRWQLLEATLGAGQLARGGLHGERAVDVREGQEAVGRRVELGGTGHVAHPGLQRRD